jgi:hypothetical protein
MRKMLRLLAITLLVCGVTVGCKTGRLEQGGAYAVVGQQQELPLMIADQLYKTSYTALDLTFKIEKDNREVLWKLNPNIKHRIDALRDAAWAVNLKWATARALYVQNPIPANLSAMELVLAEMQKLVPIAQQILVTQGVK